MQEFVKKGGNPADVRKKTSDLGIKIENAIGFSKWIVDDNVVRKAALEQSLSLVLQTCDNND